MENSFCDQDQKRVCLSNENEGESNEENSFSVSENATLYECAFNIFKGNVASAVFLLPTFYKTAGYIMSPIIGFFIGLIVVDCSRLLVRAKNKVGQESVRDYLNLCGFVLGTPFRYVLLFSLLLTQFGFCLLYVQLVGGLMAKLINFIPESEYVWMTVMFCIVLPVSFFSDNIRFLAFLSIIATVCVVFALSTTLVLSFSKLHTSGVTQNVTILGNSIPFGWFNNMANNLMMLEGIGVVLPVENACKNKRRYSFMLTVVLLLIVFFYLLYGLTGYLAYGDVLTISLIDEVEKGALSYILRVAFIINILFTYPVLFMPGILQLDIFFGWGPRSWKAILLRIFISLIIYGIAMGAGSGAVKTVVSLIGALPATVMLLILPSLLSLCLESDTDAYHEKRSSWKVWRRNLFEKRLTFIRLRAYIYIFLAVIIMVAGTYSVF